MDTFLLVDDPSIENKRAAKEAQHRHLPSYYDDITSVMPQYPWPRYIREEAKEETERSIISHTHHHTLHSHTHPSTSTSASASASTLRSSEI
jgi:hypothetical protein